MGSLKRPAVFLGAMVLVILGISAALASGFSYTTQWGSQGSGNGEFNFPWGVVVDQSDAVYVVDSSNHRIQKFTSDGTYVTQWGSNGSGNGQFILTYGAAIDQSGAVYVTDFGNHRIQKFTSDGTYTTQWGSSGSGNGQFSNPMGVAVDSSGAVYVVDSNNHRIQKFTSDGTYTTQWGSNGSGNGQFKGPRGVAIDGSGAVYIADYINYRIQKFTSDGTYVTQWGSYGSGNGQFKSPAYVAVDALGAVYVTDSLNYRIQKFTSDGTYVTQWGSAGSGNGQFNYPLGVAVDTSGAVYVAENDNHRIQKFTDTAPPTDPTISSPSHQAGEWSKDRTVDIEIHPDAVDLGTGVAGYSITFSKDATEVPTQVVCTSDTPNATDIYTSPALDDGAWYANVSTVDNAGNWTSTAHLGPFQIDTTKPTASLKINGGEVYTNSSNVTLNISAEDNLSGLYWMRVRNKGGEWSSWEDFKTTKEWELSEASIATLGGTDGAKEVELEVKDRAYNHSAIVSDTIKLDTQKSTTRMVTPFVSTKISKTTSFKVKWSAKDASPSSGIKHYTVKYRRSGSSVWRIWKSNTTATQGLFKGRAGRTYYFRAITTDNAGNKGWSKVYKTVVPFNEGIFLRKIGFFGYKKLGKSQNYLTSVRYSHKRGHTIVYKLYRTNGIGLVVTKGPKMGRAKIYVDGKYVRTIDAKSSKIRPRQLIFYRNFKKKGTHYLKVINLGTPGRAKFEIDAVVNKR